MQRRLLTVSVGACLLACALTQNPGAPHAGASTRACAPPAPPPTTERWHYRTLHEVGGTWYDSEHPGQAFSIDALLLALDPDSARIDVFGRQVRRATLAMVLTELGGRGWRLVTHTSTSTPCGRTRARASPSGHLDLRAARRRDTQSL